MEKNRQLLIGASGLLIATAVCISLWCVYQKPISNIYSRAQQVIGTSILLNSLLEFPHEELARLDIAHLNLMCSEGLPGGEHLNPEEYICRLEDWTRHVRTETQRHLHRFRRNPTEYERSEGFFRMLMMAVVLTEDFKVHYAPSRRVDPSMASTLDGFFSDAGNVFLHGLLGPKRQGTCSSLPVLYVALGRRLGYPLKLVTTKGHLFVRWEGMGERFNVEVTGQGLSRFEDEYYRHWPFEITNEEVEAEGYLESLTPKEELAVFLSIRGMCLREAGRRAEAAETFASAARLAPGCRSYQLLARMRVGLPENGVRPNTVASMR